MTHVEAIEAVFGCVPSLVGVGGTRRAIQVLSAAAVQLVELGVTARIGTHWGAIAVFVALPWAKEEFMVATNATPRVGPCTIPTSLWEWAEIRPTMIAKGQEKGMALLMPLLQHPDPVRQRAGERIFYLHNVPIGKGQWHQVPILMAPNCRLLVMPDTEVVGQSKAKKGQPTDMKLLSGWLDSWVQLANVLCRDMEGADGLLLSEEQILRAVQRQHSAYRRLFPVMEGANGIPGEMLEALSSRVNILAAPRIEKGGNMLLMGSSKLNFDECSISLQVIRRLEADASRAGDPFILSLGDLILMSRRPISMPVALRVASFHEDTLAIKISPRLAEVLESDFDGDCVDVKVVPSLDAIGLLPSRVFQQAEHKVATPVVGYPKLTPAVGEAAKNAMATQVANKRLMGMSVTQWRLRVGMVECFRHIDPMKVSLDMVAISDAFGEEITDEAFRKKFNGLQDGGTLFGRLFAEAMISKQQQVGHQALLDVLDAALKTPGASLKKLLSLGGIFSDNRYAVALTCYMLAGQAAKFTELLESAPLSRLLPLSAGSWADSIPDLLAELDANGLENVLS